MSPDGSSPDELRVRARCVSPRAFELLSNAWGLCIGVLSVIGAVLFYLSPEAAGQSAVDRELGAMAAAWNLGYGAGGVLIVYGLLARSRPADALGLSLLATTVAINAVVIVATYGPRSVTTVPTLLAVGLAAVARVLVVGAYVRPRDPHGGRP